MNLLLAIAAGGAIGALGRHFVSSQLTHWLGGGFPWGILICNVVGSFAMGCLVEVMALKWSVGVEFRAFMTVGILGAFTTFSTFSLDTVLLLERGAYVSAMVYVVTSVALSVGGLVAGMALFRQVLA